MSVVKGFDIEWPKKLIWKDLYIINQYLDQFFKIMHTFWVISIWVVFILKSSIEISTNFPDIDKIIFPDLDQSNTSHQNHENYICYICDTNSWNCQCIILIWYFRFWSWNKRILTIFTGLYGRWAFRFVQSKEKWRRLIRRIKMTERDKVVKRRKSV